MRNVNTVGRTVHICFGALQIIVMNTFRNFFFSLFGNATVAAV